LYSVTRLGNLGVIENLVKHGADINALNKDGGFPLICAIRFGHVDIAKFLIKHGADIDLQTSNGDTPLGVALRSRSSGELVDLLLNKGARDPGLKEILEEIESGSDSGSDYSDQTIVGDR
jgi:ankyrin repeat protein